MATVLLSISTNTFCGLCCARSSPLSVGSSRIASPAFSYFFANRQHRQVAKSLSRAPAHPRYILKKREPTRALVGLARGQGTTQGQGTRQGHRTTQGQGTTRGQRTKQGQGTSQQGKLTWKFKNVLRPEETGPIIGHEKSCMTALKIVYVVYQNRVRGLFFRPPLNFFSPLDSANLRTVSFIKSGPNFSKKYVRWRQSAYLRGRLIIHECQTWKKIEKFSKKKLRNFPLSS